MTQNWGARREPKKVPLPKAHTDFAQGGFMRWPCPPRQWADLFAGRLQIGGLGLLDTDEAIFCVGRWRSQPLIRTTSFLIVE